MALIAMISTYSTALRSLPMLCKPPNHEFDGFPHLPIFTSQSMTVIYCGDAEHACIRDNEDGFLSTYPVHIQRRVSKVRVIHKPVHL